jgi:hypothetical protein
MIHAGPTKALTIAIWALFMASPSTVVGDQGTISPVLIELFTSEGCSSCPPADAFLGQLDASQPLPGAQLIVLSEHVDYWNHEGWLDPFSSASLTERQRGYVRALRLREAYTPQFIVDGAAEMRLSERQKITQVLKDAATSPKIPVAIAALEVQSGTPTLVTGRVTAEGVEGQKGDVYLGLALDHFESTVLRGENRGRQLSHVAVLLDLVKLGPLPVGAKFSQDFHVPLKAGIDPGNVRIIAFVQEAGQGKVVGAALQRTSHSL